LFSRIGYSARPTQDIDFFGRSIPNSEERIRQAFQTKRFRFDNLMYGTGSGATGRFPGLKHTTISKASLLLNKTTIPQVKAKESILKEVIDSPAFKKRNHRLVATFVKRASFTFLELWIQI
jgi:hypothetical protein